MIDENGYRLNVGIIITNEMGQLFWGRRVGQEAWQFPQGGIHENESAEQALYRELHEEVGLTNEDVSMVAQSEQWLSYKLPKRLVRTDTQPMCIGQKQRWFVLQLLDEQKVNLEASVKPEFDDWQWVSYWYPLFQVVTFKKEVYRQALLEFAPQILALHKPLMHLDPLD